VSDDYINEANHVGNDAFVRLFNDSAVAYFHSRGAQPYTVHNQVLINSGFSVQLKSEALPGDALEIHLGVENFHRCGCDFLYRINNADSGTLVARARFSFLTFDYQAGRLVDANEGFKDFFVRG
jgi:acyl-CoA thioesterase FadM